MCIFIGKPWTSCSSDTSSRRYCHGMVNNLRICTDWWHQPNLAHGNNGRSEPVYDASHWQPFSFWNFETKSFTSAKFIIPICKIMAKFVIIVPRNSIVRNAPLPPQRHPSTCLGLWIFIQILFVDIADEWKIIFLMNHFSKICRGIMQIFKKNLEIFQNSKILATQFLL